MAPVDESRPPPSLSAQLSGIDLVICLLLPVVGFVAGLVRLVRGDPTAGRMMLISGTILLGAALLGSLGR